MKFETDKKSLGYKFKQYRMSRNLTQFELAEKVGLNEKQVYRIEAGLNYPTYLTFVKLIDVLDININDFIQSAPISNKPMLDEILNILKGAKAEELKMFLDVLNALKKNLND